MKSIVRIATRGCLAAAALLFTAVTAAHAALAPPVAPAVWMMDVTVAPGTTFTVPIMIDSTGAPFTGYDLELTNSAPTVAAITAIADAGIFPGGFFGAVNEATSDHARLAGIDFGFEDHVAVGPVAIVTMQASSSPGTTVLAFVTDRPGFEALANTNAEDLTDLYTFAGATITVGVPEPTAVALIGMPLLGLLIRRRRV